MQLTIKNGPLSGSEILLIAESISIGRNPEATLSLDDKKVSRNHAVVEWCPESQGWQIRDLGSTNLTFVNGKAVTKSILCVSDTIRVGSTEISVEALPISDSIDISLELSPDNLQQALRNSNSSFEHGLQEALFKISMISTPESTKSELLDSSMPILKTAINYTSWAWLEWADGLEYDYTTHSSNLGGSYKEEPLTLSRSLIDQAFRLRRGIVSGEVAESFDQSMEIRQETVLSAMVVPLLTKSKKSYALYLERSCEFSAFSSTDLERAAVLASQICQSVENVALYEELHNAYNNLDQYLTHLNKAEKLATIGRMAAGFAHDLNNPLSSLMGFVELAQRLVAKDVQGEAARKLESHLAKAMDAADFCRALSRNVLAFARQTPFDKGKNCSFDARETILNTLGICDSSLRSSGAQVVCDLDQGLMVAGDPSALQQVVMNLLTNASDAIGEANIGNGIIKLTAKSEAGKIVITVSDNGPGIPEKNQSRIFEPLFTTKGEKKGTGLGLFVVSSIITDAGGELKLSSNPGEGTLFTVVLPECIKAPGQHARNDDNQEHDRESELIA